MYCILERAAVVLGLMLAAVFVGNLHAQSVPDKIKASELVGEKGAEAWAKSQGWTPILTIDNKGTMPQGFDQVWRTKEGHIAILEAKGGNSPIPKRAGEELEHHLLGQAQRMLDRGSDVQKKAARLFLDERAAGKPIVWRAISTSNHGAAPILSDTYVIRHVPVSKLGTITKFGNIANGFGKLSKIAGKAAAPVAIVITIVEVGKLGIDVADIVTDPDLGEQNKVIKVTQKIVGFVPAQVPFLGEELEKASANLVENYEYELYQGYSQVKELSKEAGDLAYEGYLRGKSLGSKAVELGERGLEITVDATKMVAKEIVRVSTAGAEVAANVVEAAAGLATDGLEAATDATRASWTYAKSWLGR